MPKKSANVVYVNAQESREFAETIAHRIATAQVKTATPSRAQNKIQVRVTWTEPNGKPGLGYYAMDCGNAEGLGKKSSGPRMKNFVDDLFRTLQWAKARAAKDGYADYGPFQEDLHNELTSLGVFNATAGIHDLLKKAMASIQACAQTGMHRNQRRSKNQEKAKAYLEGNILFALKNGLTDAEINDVVQLAFVKHTMESSPFIALLIGEIFRWHGQFTVTHIFTLAVVTLVSLLDQWRSAGKTTSLPPCDLKVADGTSRMPFGNTDQTLFRMKN